MAAAASSGVAAQEPVPNAVCALCHGDVAQERGLEGGGLHAEIACVDCHVALRDFDTDEMEHDENVPPASCVECHAQEVQRAATSLHAENDVGCAVCHGTHDIRPVHAADAPVAAARLNRLCGTCHGDVLSKEADGVHAEALAGRTCLACHDPHAAAAPAPSADDASCLSCHEEDDAERYGMLGAPLESTGSVHGRARIGCVLCHAGLSDVQSFPHGPDGPVNCGRCHGEANDAWKRGVHDGKPGAPDGVGGVGGEAARCEDCHGAHAVQPVGDPRSLVFALNLPDTCERCHDPEQPAEPPAGHPAPAGELVAQYETSAHGIALRKDGLIVTATCASCHGSHEIRHAGDPEAATARDRVPYTCGACHVGILNGYLAGAHGSAFIAGGADVPVCTDCHSEHTISGPEAAGSTVASEKVAEICARCHANDKLAQEYGFPRTALLSWGRSYHGIASALGEKRAANCASCHGFHEILPSSDPRSQIHPANLERTCGGCHEGWGAAFVQVPVHTVIERDSNAVAWWLRSIYTVLIVATIGAFLLFIVVDLLGRIRLRLGIGPRGTEPVPAELLLDEERLMPADETFPRLSRQARVQHGLLVTSFVLLVVTGLPLFLSQLPVMRALVGFEGGWRLRGGLHRAGAIGLIGLSAWHVLGTLLHPGGRRWLRSMMIWPRDVIDLVREFLFNLGLAKERPRFGRYGLVEKLEYGAVVWGNIVMIASGTMLWRPDWFFGRVPAWAFDVCRIVHGYEATLAFLAIIVWHMYHVHLRPEVFPMSRAWLDGRISRDEMRHHHTREYVALLEARRAAAQEGKG